MAAAATYTRLQLALGEWQSNFVALPQEFASALRSSADFGSQGVICLKLQWTSSLDAQGKPVAKECFVGWSGLISRGPYLQCPRALAQHAGLLASSSSSSTDSDNTVLLLNVYAQRQCAVAKRVDIEPAEYEDWEMLEKHASFVEEQLLGQMAVLSADQSFTVWVANVPVRLRVTAIEGSSGGGGAVRLGNNTELVVAPKPRPVVPPTQQQQPQSEAGVVALPPPPRFTSSSKGKPARLRAQLLPASSSLSFLDGVAYVCRDTLDALREQAGWNAAASEYVAHNNNKAASGVGEILNPETRIFVQVMMAGAGGGGGAVLALDVSDEVAPQHVGLTRASARQDVRAFHRVTLRPISAVEHLQPYAPEQLVLRRLVSSSSSSSSPVEKDAVLRAVGQLGSGGGVAVQHDGCWLDLSGSSSLGTFKLVSPVTNKFWFAKDKPDKFTFGDDIPIEDASPPQRPVVLLPKSAQHVLREIKAHFAPLLARKQASRLPTAFSGGVYLHAPRGFGKRTLLRELERDLGHDSGFLTSVVFVDCCALRGGKRQQVTEAVDAALAQAEEQSPSLVVFEELDSLLPQPANPAEEEDASTVWLCEYLETRVVEHKKKTNGTAVIGFAATGRGKRSLKVQLLRLGSCFERAIELPSLDRDARACVLASLSGQGKGTAAEFEDIAAKTEGYTCADLETLHTRSSQLAADGGGASSSLALALDGFVPANLRGVKLAKSETQWSDVGGLEQVRDVLKDTLELPFQFAELYKTSPLRLASGILLYGASGTGKTLLAGAVASECGLNFISVKGPEILNKYIGASEQAIRDLFARAASVAPCVIFFDEFDAIAPRRGNDSTGVTDRVVNQMLTFLDGVESREGVYVMAATSRPDLVDPALLRPGRLDKQLYCSFPTASERASILRAVSRKAQLSQDCDAVMDSIAERGTELTGADLQALVATAQLLAAHDHALAITPDHLERAFQDTRPSVGRQDRAKLEQLYAKFRGDRDTSFADEAEGKQRVALM